MGDEIDVASIDVAHGVKQPYSAPLIGFQLGAIVKGPNCELFAVKSESWDAVRANAKRRADGRNPKTFFSDRISAIGR